MVTIEIAADTADEATEAVRMLVRGTGPTITEYLKMTRMVADKVDERLAELKEAGVFDPPTS